MFSTLLKGSAVIIALQPLSSDHIRPRLIEIPVAVGFFEDREATPEESCVIFNTCNQSVYNEPPACWPYCPGVYEDPSYSQRLVRPSWSNRQYPQQQYQPPIQPRRLPKCITGIDEAGYLHKQCFYD